MMSITREGTLEKVRVFGYAQVSSYLQRYANSGTIKELAEDIGVSYNGLIQMKNMKIKNPSLNKITDLMNKLGMDYEITVVRKNGVSTLRMVVERVQYVEPPEKKFHYDYPIRATKTGYVITGGMR